MNSTSLFDKLIKDLPQGRILNVQVGLFWTAVLADVDGHRCCGLAATTKGESQHATSGPPIMNAGKLTGLNGRELAQLVHSSSPEEVSVGLAGINALLPRLDTLWMEANAEEIIAKHGSNKNVALVGHFPFVSRLRERVGLLWVLEKNPQAGDIPAGETGKIIPCADVVAITAMTLVNRTIDGLLPLRRPGALTMMLGPTTPLSPILFELGIDILSGAIVEDIEPVLLGVSQGANFRQLHQLGIRLVSMAANPDLLGTVKST